MPELSFKGKEFVYSHHLAVPHRPLVPDAAKSIGDVRLDGNLIIHGDNLHALKSLLPMYAGKVDCIFIDPPYNTGNEGWGYNDNVNSPMMQEWLRSNPVGIEDGLRHDKWCAMMWPRLRLLKELLADSGSLWMSLDDNEIHRARSMLDEIFGESRFVGIFVVVNNLKGRNDKENIALTHEYMLVYSNDEFLSRGLELSEEQLAEFSNTDQNGNKFALRDLRKRGSEDRRSDRESMYFPIYWNRTVNSLSLERADQSDTEIFPKRGDGSDGRWRWGKERVGANLANLVPREGASGRFDIDYKVFLNDSDDEEAIRRKPKSTWTGSEFSTDVATTLIKGIFGHNPLSHSPKPIEQVLRCVELSTGKNGIVLDSFAGSGTTAHAVLTANKKDGGNRKFILVECEDYADTLTSERVRRVINGYEFSGTQREELLRKSLTFTDLKQAANSNGLLNQIASIENLETHRFDRIEKKVKDGELLVEGVKNIQERTEGLGGKFTYCTLGEAVDMDRMLTGENLPTFEALGALLFHMATNEAINPASVSVQDGLGYLGESANFHVWLIYKPELDFLKSREAALTMAKAKALVEEKPGKRHLVFAPAKFVAQKLLDEANLPVEFAPLPWALYRAERG